VEVTYLINAEKWSLFYSLSLERVEKEIIYTPIAAFKFWEQQDFKELLNEVMDKSSFSSSARRKKKCKVLAIYYWAYSKLDKLIYWSCSRRLQVNSSIKNGLNQSPGIASSKACVN